MTDSSGDRNPVEILAEEFIDRQRRGEKPTLSEYTARYPELAAEIRDLFPALLMMEDLGESSLAATGPHIPAVAPVRQLGEYRILREVGRGGMGVVYEAEQQSLGRRVALKVLPPHSLNGAQQVRRFEREAKAAARLHHTNIVPVYGVGNDEDTHYYVMQFIPGLGLDGVMEELRQLRVRKAREPEAAAAQGSPQIPRETPTMGSRPVAASQSQRQAAQQAALSLITGNFHPVNAGRESENSPSQADIDEAAESTVTDGAADSSLPRLPDGSDLSSLSQSDARYWRSVARIGAQVADALEYAHGQGILHRDVKPSNLLMDMNGKVWVTDFGLAKSDDAENLTNTGDIVGTVRYMAPERFQGHSDARSDVYSLGLTLYELLALRPAFEQRDRALLIQQVLHEEPSPLRSLNRAVPRDLETIVQKAIAKEPDRRYPRAADLAADLQRFLEDRPVQARRAGGAERVWRWCRRQPALASAVGFAAFALLGMTIVSSLFAYFQSSTNTQLFKVNSDLTDKQQKLEFEQGQTLQEKQNTVEAMNKFRRESVHLAAERSRVLAESHDRNHALLWLARALENAPEDAEDLQFPLRANLVGLRPEYRTPPAKPLLAVKGQVVAKSPDGKKLLTRPGGKDAVQLVDAQTGKPIGEPHKFPAALFHAAFFPDGKRFVTASDLSNPNEIKAEIKAEVRIWDASTGEPLTAARQFPGVIGCLAMSSDGKRFVTGHSGGVARLWDADKADLPITVLDHGAPAGNGRAVTEAVFSPDDSRLLTIWDYEARLWDTASGKAVGGPMRHERGVSYLSMVVVFSPDSKFVATGGGDGLVRLWNSATGEPVGTPLRHSHWVQRVGFSPDGKVLKTMAALDDQMNSKKYEYRLWRIPNGEPVGSVMRPVESNGGLGFSPDGLMVWGYPFTHGWDVETGKPIGTALPVPVILPHRDLVSAIAFSPDGTRLITGTRITRVGGPQSAYLWDRSTGQPIGQPMQQAEGISTVAFSPDGNLVLTAGSGRDCSGQLWDGHTGKRRGPALDYGHGPIEVGAFSKDGRTVLLGGYAKGSFETARMWDVESGKRVGAPLVQKGGAVKTLAWSLDGLRIVTGGGDGNMVQLWDARSGQPLVECSGHTSAVRSVGFSPDGSLVLTASDDRTARVWNGLTGASVLVLKHERSVSQALFSPNGKTIFTASVDKTGRLWDAQTGQAIGLPWQHPAAVLCAAFSPDGKTVATGCGDGNARLWAAETGIAIGPPLPHPAPVTAVVFSPDGRSFATVCGDNAARLWDVPQPVAGAVRRLVLWAQVETGMELDARGAVHTLDETALAQRRRELDEAGGPPLPSGNEPEREADRHYRIAMGCVLTGHWYSATWHLEQTLKIRPKDWTAWLLQGQALYNLGKSDPAAVAYARAFEFGPKETVLAACTLHLETYLSAEITSMRLITDKTLGEKWKRGAVWFLDQMIASDPANWKLYDRRGWVHGDLGLDEQAEEDYRRAVALGPDASFYGRYKEGGNEQTGWAFRHLARHQWQQAADDFARVVELNENDDLAAWQVHALLRLYVGDAVGYHHACNVLVARARDQWPSFFLVLGYVGTICTYGPDATENAGRAITWLEDATRSSLRSTFSPVVGAAYYRAGRLEEAIVCLSEWAKDNRPQPDIWLYLAMAHRRLGHTEEADKWRAKELEWFTKETQPAAPGEVKSESVVAPARLLQALVMHKEWENFEKLDESVLVKLNQAAAKLPEEPAPLLRRGRFHANRGQWDKAAADFDRVLELWPKEPRFWVERARFCIQRGQRDRAGADLARATALRPDDVDLRLECARLRVIARDWKGAAADFRLALPSRLDDVPLRIECGQAEASAGAWSQAVADFKSVVEKKPEVAQHWNYLALAQLGGGDRAAYRETCAGMIERFRKSPDGATVSQLVFTCAVTPDADADMPAFAELADKLFYAVHYLPWGNYDVGAALYRAGKLPQTLRYFDPRYHRKPGPLPWLFLAMAHQRLSHGQEALDYLAKAETWMAAADKQDGESLGGIRAAWSDWRERLIAKTLHREAEALIKSAKP